MSGKVVGNVGEQWKEVRVNHVQNKVKQSQEQEKTGKKIVPIDGAVQQVQTANKFAILEVEEGEKNKNNQLVLIEESNEQRSPIHYPKATGSLNPATAVFSSPGITKSKKGNNANHNGSGNATAEGVQKESTAQWVPRTFGVVDSKENDRLQLSGK